MKIVSGILSVMRRVLRGVGRPFIAVGQTLKKHAARIAAIVLPSVALGLVGAGLWRYMNYGALAPVGFLLWIDLTIWSLKTGSVNP